MKYTIAIGSDHAGFDVKESIVKALNSGMLEEFNAGVSDMGPDSSDRVDYPDYAHKVAQSVSEGICDLGILICGSGNGVCITANKHDGIRAGLAWDTELASLAR